MMQAMLSILGMYNHDDSIFEHFRVPNGMSREDAINKILFDNAELGLVYLDPDILKIMIKTWVNTNFSNWEKMWSAISASYNPIHNYNMTETWTENMTRNNEREVSESSSVSKNGTKTGSIDHDVAGFNENQNLVKQSKDSTLESTQDGMSTTDSGESSDSMTGENVHTGEKSGNIGVTTSQQMLEAEMDVRKKYNIYNIISESFKFNFCIMVY